MACLGALQHSLPREITLRLIFSKLINTINEDNSKDDQKNTPKYLYIAIY
jgi:hypothetical protein